MLTLEAGRYRCPNTRGDRVIHVDRDLSREQVDVVLAAIDAAGQTIDNTVAVSMTEGQTVVTWQWWDGLTWTEHHTVTTARPTDPAPRVSARHDRRPLA